MAEKKSPPKSASLAKEKTFEDAINEFGFSRNVTTKSSALFFGNAVIVSFVPIWLFWRIHQMDLLPFFAVVTALSTYLLSMAYKNTKFTLKHKIANKREDAVTREMNQLFADDKKMSRKEKDERILWKKNEIADYEATTFSIFYNNAIFLTIVVFASFFILRSFTPAFNYIVSVGGASGLLALLSTGKAN